MVVVDDNDESRAALRFAARRAAKTGGSVEILALVPQQEFVQWGAVQATLEEEARLRAEAMVAQAASSLIEDTGIMPAITVRQGDPVAVVRELLAEQPHVAALVLGAAAAGNPGKLITHFAGTDAGLLPCPLMIVPGSLDDEAIDRLS
jgi:hypothetical protein